ncbi:BLUF domain-containing protein [Planctobacterium marinum]|uniref:BLUF domain-containing protein n=1 Tax=Planctobacterium marinum TaxID=1631968 RepID=A0AA48KQH7_9ALTE|nr:hypothetical protein MACH26_20340 [Planctobacterium marinum]
MMRLIYTSKIASSISAGDMENIIVNSQAYNQRAAITGLLICNFDCFFQVLEGPDLLVQMLFDKIKTDPRHERVKVISTRQADHRMFPGWSMRYLMLPSEKPPVINDDWTQLTKKECQVLLDMLAPASV